MKYKMLVGLSVLVAFAVSLFTLDVTSTTKASNTVVLSADNTVVLSDVIEGEAASKILSQTKDLNRKTSWNNKPIYLFLNTPGGSIQTGLEMIEALNGNGRPVSTVTLFAASMGFQLVQNLGERLILKNGVLMSHRAAGEFTGQFGGQSPSQVENRFKLWNQRITEMDEQTVKRTGGKQTLESYQKAYANELWLTGTQAVAGGYADRMVTVKCDSSLDGVTTHSLSFMGLRVMYDTDNCPLNTSPMNIRISSPDNQRVGPNESASTEAKFLEQYFNKQKSVVPMY
jgi:ATP-dependent Clp protease, protease subunit